MFKETNSSFHAEIYSMIWKMSIKPILRSWTQEIMSSPDMSEVERRGKIYAYQEIYKGFLAMYANSKLEVPEWLIEEFHV